jgi:hypothetical protein
MEDRPVVRRGSSRSRQRRRVPRGRIGAADGRNLADSEGQQGITNREVSGHFTAIGLGRETAGLGLHGSSHTAAANPDSASFLAAGVRSRLAIGPTVRVKRLARMPSTMTQSRHDPPAAAAGTPPLRAGGDMETTARALLAAAALAAPCGGERAGTHLCTSTRRRAGVGIGGERRTSGLADRPQQAGRRLAPGGAGCRGHNQPPLGRGRLPQRAAAVGRPAPGSNLAWRRCSVRRLARGQWAHDLSLIPAAMDDPRVMIVGSQDVRDETGSGRG